MKTQRMWTRVGMICVAGSLLLVPTVGQAQTANTLQGDRGLYLGGTFGISSVEIGGSSMQLEGINFSNVSADDDDLGSRIHVGYWITDYIGVEAGFSDRGKVTATFDFDDPRNDRSGSGDTEVSVDSFDVSLLVGGNVLPNVRLFGMVGYLGWGTDYETRFDVAGEPSVHRDFDQSGSDLLFGGGASWNFHSGWSLRAQAEFMEIDITDVQMFSLGLEYDLMAWAGAR